MQPDAFADEFRGSEIAFDHLPGHEHHPDPDHACECVELHQRRNACQDEAGCRTDVRYEYQQPGENADRQKVGESGEPQTERIEQRHRADDEHLPVQILAEGIVRFPKQPHDRTFPPPWDQQPRLADDARPIAQHEEQHHRHQHGVGEQAEQSQSAHAQRGEHAPAEAFTRLQRVADGFLDRGRIEPQVGTQPCVDPRCDVRVEPLEPAGQFARELLDLRHEQRQHDQHQQHQ